MWYHNDVLTQVFYEAWQFCLTEQQSRYPIVWNRHRSNPRLADTWSFSWQACLAFVQRD